ncbi:MAG: CADD family putative folate metabolism protein [Thermoplasmata archaeon]|nr:CADD family putative folate metabolism protein [Thermoplasmata archaeon]
MRPTAPIDRLIRQRHLLTHPFYTAWSKGELPIPTLRDYAEQYYRFESDFPRYVAATYAHLTDPAQRRQLLENLVDEEGRDPTHPALWLDFAKGIGGRSNPARFSPPRPATRNLTRTYERLTFDGTAAQGLGALYSYESQFPEVAAEKSRGLRAHYGITDPRTHEFFRVHSEADVEHSAAERRVLARAVRDSPAAQLQALRASRAALGAWWSFLDQFMG